MDRPQAIVYSSNTGFTARYAAMLGKETGLEVYRLEDREVPRGTAVIFLGWICAGSIKGLQKARRRFQVCCVCAVGMTPKELFDARKIVENQHLEGMPLFYLRGGLDPARLRGPMKWMIRMAAKGVEKAPGEGAEERAMAESFQGGDWVDREDLGPVLTWLG